MRLSARIRNLRLVGDFVERRHREKQMPVLDQLRHLLIEERNQQRRDVRAVHVGVRHDDHALVAQIFVAIFGSRARAERLDEIGEKLVLRKLRGRSIRDVQNLAAQRQNSLRFAIACALGAATGRVALDDENFGARSLLDRAIGKLARQTQLARRRLAPDFFFPPPLQTFFRLIDGPLEQLRRLLRRIREPVIESIAHRRFDDLRRFDSRELVFRLPLELRFADENGQRRCRRAHHVFRRDLLRLLVSRQLAIGAKPFVESLPQPVFVRAAFGRRNRVAIGEREAVLVRNPGDRPFDRAVTALFFDATRKNILRDARAAVDGLSQIVGEAAGEVENGFRRRIVLDQFRRALPADLDAREKISLGARHFQKPRRLECRAFAENLLVRTETNLGAAPVHDRTELFELRLRNTARKDHPIKLLVARHLHFERFRKCVDDGHADAVQAA